MSRFWTIGNSTRPDVAGLTTRRGYHGLRLADCSLGGATGGGGTPTTLERTTSGLLYFSDFTGSDGDMDGFDSWDTVQGSWAILSNQATVTTNGGFDRIQRLTPTATAMVVETRQKHQAGYIGHCIMNLDSSNYWQSIIHVSERQYRSIVSGSDVGGATAAGGTGLVVDTWHYWKTSFRAGKILGQWLDKVAKLGPTFDASGVTGNTAASGFGLLVYESDNALWDYIAVYTSTLMTVTGLSGTMAWRLMDAGDVEVAASAAQSGGSAIVEVGTAIDCPFTGYLELHTDDGFTDLLARYPESSTAADIYGGDSYAFV